MTTSDPNGLVSVIEVVGIMVEYTVVASNCLALNRAGA